MDQDDLELSFSKDENKASLGSLRHLEDIDALLPHSIDEEKQPPSSGSNGTKALLWMIANVIASIAFVRLYPKSHPIKNRLLLNGFRCC